MFALKGKLRSRCYAMVRERLTTLQFLNRRVYSIGCLRSSPNVDRRLYGWFTPLIPGTWIRKEITQNRKLVYASTYLLLGVTFKLLGLSVSSTALTIVMKNTISSVGCSAPLSPRLTLPDPDGCSRNGGVGRAPSS